MVTRRGFFGLLAAGVTAAWGWRPRGIQSHTLGAHGSTPTMNGVAFHPKAFSAAMVPLELPAEAVFVPIRPNATPGCYVVSGGQLWLIGDETIELTGEVFRG